ncbi:MAG: CRTAC1 family protein [Flavobacteriales bacterium]
MCAIVIHGVGSAQLVVDAIGSELVSDHTGGYLGTGVSFADFNGDGLDDLTFGHHDGALSFYAGNGDGFDPIDLGLELPIAEAKGVLWADIDNDGDQDLFVAYRFAPNKLWLNDGEMGFEDVSSSCGIAQDNRRSFGPAFGDFDRDGLLDLFVANYGYAVDVPQGNELYRNVGGGQFEDVTAEFGLDGENLQSFQATWMDVDRDGWLDLHVIRDRLIFPNLFYHNKAEEQGAVWFEEEAQARGMDAMLNCMSSSPHDYDRDGDLDLFIAGGLEGNMLLVNDGDGYYTDATNDLVQMNEVCWSGQWLDVDADGWEELHVATGFANYTDYPQVLFQFSDEPDALFQNDAGNLVEAGELYQSESALAFATVTGDYDGDGFVDFVSHQVGPHPEVRRSIPNGNAGMRILLHGTASNADAVGSKIELWAGADYWYRETHCGEGYLAQNSRWEHFGLANHTTVDSIKVQWPLGSVETWHDVQVQATLELTEGSACAPDCAGCTYDGACNYDPDAFIDDGSCDFSCLIEQSVCGEGLMWNPETAQCENPCPADLTGDYQVDVADLLVMLGAYASFCPE